MYINVIIFLSTKIGVIEYSDISDVYVLYIQLLPEEQKKLYTMISYHLYATYDTVKRINLTSCKWVWKIME
jgi:hypothetical protein